jgi:hypothetical protein
VRGEAALVLAASGDDRHYEAVLAVARADEPEARWRGILALGYLGAPGTEQPLVEVLDASASRPEPEAVLAAHALGLLRDASAAAAVTGYLNRFLQSSFKRQHDVLLALLAALATRAADPQRLALQRVLDDDANRDPRLRAALLATLARIDGGIDQERAVAALRRGSPEERCAVLAWLATREQPLDELLPTLTRLAGHDADGGVRAGALAALTRIRHLPALDLAARAIRSDDPREVAQGTRTALLLGGSGMRRAIERQFAALPPANQTAVLGEFQGAISETFGDACLELAANRRLGLELRTAAALALAQADVREVAPVVRSLFLEHEDGAALAALARAMLRLESTPPELERLHRGTRLEELALASDRVRALLMAGHPAAVRLCLEQLQRADVDAETAASLLRAVRRSLLPAPAGTLPPPLRQLLD